MGAERVRCIRISDPVDGFQIPLGQYALRLQSSQPIICQIGRMDVQQPNLAYYTVLATMAWSGYALEAAFLWWLPRRIGFTYILIFLSWAPHYPFDGKGRYGDTRAWKSPVGTLLSLGMEYHVVHHLFPKIPLLQTAPAYRDLRDVIEKRGIRIDGL